LSQLENQKSNSAIMATERPKPYGLVIDDCRGVDGDVWSDDSTTNAVGKLAGLSGLNHWLINGTSWVGVSGDVDFGD
ncbi:hypothetical protein OFN56_34260, partial [Escherichia coli]|nr:hypothetical protein [Escherichia coli]